MSDPNLLVPMTAPNEPTLVVVVLLVLLNAGYRCV